AAGFDLAPFWKHSVFSAVLARAMAEELECAAKEELFICGLLLDVGKLPLYWREPDLHREVMRRRREGHGADWEIERELLGYDHAPVGAELARRWNFSPLLVDTIARHHELPANDATLPQRIAALAGRLCEVADWEVEEEPAQLPDLEYTGLEEETLRRL